METILQEWEDFARTIEPSAFTMDSTALRDHASFMLKTIAEDLCNPQTWIEGSEKSKGHGPRGEKDTAAELHAVERLHAGYTVNQLVSEYRALRFSVLNHWNKAAKNGLPTHMTDMMRFNEGIDQALAESIARITTDMTENDRQRLQAILEVIPVGISMADANGKLILVNPENKRIWGEHPLSENVADYGEWKGRWSDSSEKHGQALEPHDWALARALRGEETPSDVVEIEPFGLPNQHRTIVLNARCIRDSEKTIIGSVVAQMDITHQVKAEAALRESEAKFRTIANAMPQMIWSTLPDGYHDYYNQQWYDFTGLPVGETDGKQWHSTFHPEDQAHAWELWLHSLATGETYEVQYRLRHHSGEYRWTLGRALPIHDESGKIIRWMGTCTDIHDQKLAEEELRESGKRKDEFLAMLAHELRNPLAPISTAAELIKLVGTDQKRLHQASNIISRQVSYMTNLVDDLLDVSRVTRGLTKLEYKNVNLKSILHSAIEQVQPLIEARHHELRLRINATDAYVLGDKTRLVQVVANILNNAAKYTPQGGEISLALEIAKTEAKIKISDNGSGIAPSLLPHIFDLFTQAERTPDRSQGGLGLGLSLVKSITSLHRGQVEATSEGLGKGSTFTIVLPLQKSEEMQPPAVIHDDIALQIAAPLRLMIVDDNVDAAQSLSALLEAKGHHVVVEENAYDALAGIGDASVQVFILDIGLPDMDGYELARRLREHPKTANAVLIALTGYGQVHDRVLSKAAGFDHHFVKPVDTQHLEIILSQVTN